MPIETLDGTPGKEEQMTAQDPAPQTAHDLPASRPKASPESVMANPFARFFGGPPLAVIVRVILLSILVGVVLHAAGLDPWNTTACGGSCWASGTWASTHCAGCGAISCSAPCWSSGSGWSSASPGRRASAAEKSLPGPGGSRAYRAGQTV